MNDIPAVPQGESTFRQIIAARRRGALWYPSRWNHDGTPVRWPAAERIPWSLNERWPIPDDAKSLIREAITTLTHTSGLDLVEQPPVDLDPDEMPERLLAGIPVVISVVQSSNLARPTSAGSAGTATRTRDNGLQEYASADVRIRADSASRNVVLHEGRHALGLAHVRSPSEVMYPRSTGQTELGEGDKVGLRSLGSVPLISPVGVTR
jgi:hypothetical protein